MTFVHNRARAQFDMHLCDGTVSRQCSFNTHSANACWFLQCTAENSPPPPKKGWNACHQKLRCILDNKRIRQLELTLGEWHSQADHLWGVQMGSAVLYLFWAECTAVCGIATAIAKNFVKRKQNCKEVPQQAADWPFFIAKAELI